MSLPILILGSLIFSFSSIILNAEANLIEVNFLYLTVGSIIITLGYQLLRRNLYQKIQQELSLYFSEDLLDYKKNLDFYIGKPDFFTTSLIWLLPIFTLALRLYSEYRNLF